jgi:hypothetical protein
MPRPRTILIALALGLLTTIAIALALAAWMPLAMYPRHTISLFVAGGRPFTASEASRLGVHNLWWGELNQASMSPPPKPVGRALLDTLRGRPPAPEPQWPTAPEGWLALARKDLVGRTDIKLRDAAPWWGTFAFGAAAQPGIHEATDHAFGWPLPALWYHVWGDVRSNLASAQDIEGGILITPRSSLELRAYSFRALPLWPVWPGLLADTALFGSLWWLILFAPATLRRILRRRRGQCPACGYDLRSTPHGSPCPECGRPAPDSRTLDSGTS